jgi:hypothetical protein
MHPPFPGAFLLEQVNNIVTKFNGSGICICGNCALTICCRGYVLPTVKVTPHVSKVCEPEPVIWQMIISTSAIIPAFRRHITICWILGYHSGDCEVLYSRRQNSSNQ